MTEAILGFLGGIPQWVQVFIISMLPIVELRGSIPVAVAYDINSWFAYVLCVFGNMLPIPFILWFIRPIISYMRQTKGLKKIGDWIHNKSVSNTGKIQKYKKWGLLIFVAIPLPGTGAWTGALVAAFLEMEFKEALISILFGVLAAGAIMLFGSHVVSWVVSLF